MIGEKLIHEKLDCGLNVYLMPKKDYNKKFAVYATNYGSIDSEFIVPGDDEHLKVPDGIAHFLEHKLFEEEFGNIFDKFAELGSSANAFTNYTNTAYLFSCANNFNENLELLMDFVQRPYFTYENVEKEKGIIEQELRMYMDDPNWVVFFNFLKALYKNHPVRIDIGGSVESIKKIDVDTLYKCYNTFYHPENMVLFAVGDFDTEKTLQQIRNNFAKRYYQPRGEIKRIYPEELKAVNKLKNVEEMSVTEPLFCMGFKDPMTGLKGNKLFKKDITSRILMDMLLARSSDLYQSIYEDGLIDDRFGVDYEGHISYGHSIISGPTNDPEQLHERILKGFKDYRKNGLAKEDFDRTKKKIWGSYIKGFNSPEFIATAFISYHFKDINILDYPDILNSVTFEDVQERFNEFIDPEFHSYSIVLPNGQ